MQNHTFELTTRLDQRGVAQTVITARRPGSANRQQIGSRSEIIRVGRPIPYLRQMYAAPAARAARLVAARVDLVHSHLGEDLAVLPIAYQAARRHDLPWIVTVHCSLRHTVRAVDPRAMILKSVGGAIEDAFLPKADAVIVLTERASAALAPALGNRLHVIPPGADPSRFHSGLPDPFPWLGRPRIVYVGRLARAKGIDVLIDAAGGLRSRAEVVIVGDGPERSHLERRAERSPARVHFVGFVANDQVPSVLAHTDVLVLPSLYEELGSILIEALQGHVPVVASKVGGIPSVVTHDENGLLIPPSNPRELAEALDRMISDDNLRARLAHGAAARGHIYSWDAVADRVLDLYRDLTGEDVVPALAEAHPRKAGPLAMGGGRES
jgi:glycosyltransferase involved in cell wall biosynthesis